jgi:hypothetical protein
LIFLLKLQLLSKIIRVKQSKIYQKLGRCFNVEMDPSNNHIREDIISDSVLGTKASSETCLNLKSDHPSCHVIKEIFWGSNCKDCEGINFNWSSSLIKPKCWYFSIMYHLL